MYVFPSKRCKFPINQLFLYKSFDFFMCIRKKKSFFHTFLGTEQIFMLFRGWNFIIYFFSKNVNRFQNRASSRQSFKSPRYCSSNYFSRKIEINLTLRYGSSNSAKFSLVYYMRSILNYFYSVLSCLYSV